jgi:hypothetical protein
MMDDSPKRYNVEYDTAKKTVTLSKGTDKSYQSVLTYSSPDMEHVLLQGDLGTNTISIQMRKVDTSKFLLINRGYHWINEMPFNK